MGEQVAAPRGFDESGEPQRLPGGGGASPGGEPVVSPAIVVGFVVERDGELLDQAVHEHLLNRAVERAGPEAHVARGHAIDILHDPVAVRFAAGEHEQDVKDRRRQRRRGLRAIVRFGTGLGACSHGGYIYRG
jgi:hypothetical protein